MDIDLLVRLMEIASPSMQEAAIAKFIADHVNGQPLKYGSAFVDAHNNVYIVKGARKNYPCFAAHIDTVHPHNRGVKISQDSGCLIGHDRAGVQCGIGGDDKTGVIVCLEALANLPAASAVLFAGEEIGCFGARNSLKSFFDRAGYILEFDAPGRGLFSYTSSGMHLFDNEGDFISRAMPVLDRFGTEWQRHPFTDVMALRSLYPVSCMNLSSGYYNWHCANEYARISDIENALEKALALVGVLGCERYSFECSAVNTAAPLSKIHPLRVEDSAYSSEKSLDFSESAYFDLLPLPTLCDSSSSGS